MTLLQQSSATGDRASSADSCHQHIQLAFGINPDLFSGGTGVDRGVGRVGELLQQIGLRDFIH